MWGATHIIIFILALSLFWLLFHSIDFNGAIIPFIVVLILVQGDNLCLNFFNPFLDFFPIYLFKNSFIH